MFGIYIFLFLGLVILFSSFFTVKQQTSAIIERFGKYASTRTSGLQLKVPIIDRVAGRVNATQTGARGAQGEYNEKGWW